MVPFSCALTQDDVLAFGMLSEVSHAIGALGKSFFLAFAQLGDESVEKLPREPLAPVFLIHKGVGDDEASPFFGKEDLAHKAACFLIKSEAIFFHLDFHFPFLLLTIKEKRFRRERDAWKERL
jgi:hypothetical protein